MEKVTTVHSMRILLITGNAMIKYTVYYKNLRLNLATFSEIKKLQNYTSEAKTVKSIFE